MKLLLALLLTEGILVRGLEGIRGVVTKDVTRRQLAKPVTPGPPAAEAGNNLAVPLLLAENQFQGDAVSGDPVLNLLLSSFFFTPVVDPSTQCLTALPFDNQVCYYEDVPDDYIAWLQKSTGKWGCWLIPSSFYFTDPTVPFFVETIDVGDRLESPTSIPISATKIRVETTMLQGGLDTPGFNYDGSGVLGTPQALPMKGPFLGTSGINEIHGTTTFQTANIFEGADGTVSTLDKLMWVDPPFENGLQAIVYSSCARYYIQRIGDLVPQLLPCGSEDLRFDLTARQWGGDEPWTSAGPVTASATPPGEITVSGRFTYGYNWSVQRTTSGVYRITFLIDPNCSTNAVIDATETSIYQAPEERALAEGDTPTLTSCVIKAAQYADGKQPLRGGGVYIDVPIAPSSGGGGGGGGGGGNGKLRK
jgi:hypothetical protein